MFAGVEPVATYFTSIAWTGYILWADAAVFSLRGRSLLTTFRFEFAWIAVLSVPLWLIFEAYNLTLRNWIYVGVPDDWFAHTIGYAWAFSTITPAIFETAALLNALRRRPTTSVSSPVEYTRPRRKSEHLRIENISLLIGAIFVTAPVLVSAEIRPYLFGFVWLGFIFLLEPINLRIGAESLWRDLRHGRMSRAVTLLWAGAVCGIFWEFWNFWAHARWVYVFPMFQDWKMFAMPLPGYLGFPPFALECFAMFAVMVPAINRLLKRIGTTTRFRREALEL